MICAGLSPTRSSADATPARHARAPVRLVSRRRGGRRRGLVGGVARRRPCRAHPPYRDHRRRRRPARLPARRLRDPAQSHRAGPRAGAPARRDISCRGRAGRQGAQLAMVPLPRDRGADGARPDRAGADLQQRLHLARPPRRADRRRARDRRRLERPRHPGGGDPRRQHCAAHRRAAGGGRRGGGEGRARARAQKLRVLGRIATERTES